MATLIGKGHIFGIPAGGSLAVKDIDGTTTISGAISPNLQSMRVGHNADVDRIKGQNGEFNSLLSSGEFIECEFSFVPEGVTIANAKTSAMIPPTLSGVVTTGLDVIRVGTFADALNAAAGNPWIYEGGGSVSLTAEGKATASFTLRRYPGITNAATITS